MQVPTKVINLGLGFQGVGQPSTKLFKAVLTENAEWPVLEVKYHTKASRKWIITQSKLWFSAKVKNYWNESLSCFVISKTDGPCCPYYIYFCLKLRGDIHTQVTMHNVNMTLKSETPTLSSLMSSVPQISVVL